MSIKGQMEMIQNSKKQELQKELQKLVQEAVFKAEDADKFLGRIMYMLDFSQNSIAYIDDSDKDF